MSAMSVKVHKANLGNDIKLALVAKAIQYATDSGERPEKPFVRDFVVPAGMNEAKRLECPAGYYRVEVLLPSGDLLSDDVVVTAGKTTDVDLKTGGSPQSWLSWQTLAGVVPTAASIEAAVVTTVGWVKRVVGDRSIELPPLDQLKDNPAIQAVTGAVLAQIFEPSRAPMLASLIKRVGDAGKITWHDITTAVEAFTDKTPQADALAHRAEPTAQPLVAQLTVRTVEPSDDDDFWNRLGRSSAVIAREGRVVRRKAMLSEDDSFYHWKLDADAGTADLDQWAIVRHDFGIEVARLPLPWRTPRPGAEEAPLEILVDRRASSRPVRTTLTVADPELGGLLSYMTAGTVGVGQPILRELVEQGIIEAALRHKQTSPLAACVAGYCAITIGDDATFERWKPWIKRLMTRHPRIPDGAIIAAHRMLRTAQTEREVAASKQAYMTAFRRGLPFFAAGVQLLQDGLFTFRNADPDAERMYQSIARVSPRLDPGQPFTVLRYPKAVSP